jgi:hypothetical protein
MTKRLVAIAAIIVWTLCGVQGRAPAQIADSKCADHANNFGGKVSSAENKAVLGCIKAQGKGTLMGTVEACLTADPNGKVQGTKDKVTSLFASGAACDGDQATDLVTDATTINTAQVNEAIGLAHDIFGPNLDAGQISPASDAQKCQDKIEQRAGQMFDAWVKQFRQCKKNAMKSGATTSAAVITACLSAAPTRGNGSGLPDPKSKVSSKGTKLGDDITADCGGTLNLAALAPGVCAGGGLQGDFTKCVQDLVECHACEAVRQADNLDIDCDTIDNDVMGTCPTATLDAQCEILNSAECLLPYPSSRFLVADGTTATGLRVNLPAAGMPTVVGPAFDPAPYNQLDGFSPMVQIMTNFPQGVDLQQSDAARLLAPECCGQPAGPPWVNTRTYNSRSLDADSPSVLIKASTGEHILHWLEIDARTTDPKRQTLFVRPAVSLEPGTRYIVALRHLKTPSGADVLPEAAFAALRDNIVTTNPAIEARRAAMESAVFTPLTTYGITRSDLVLAFDFTTQSDSQLTRQMLSMRDQAFTWLATVEADPMQIPFTVTSTTMISDCSQPSDVEWKRVSGTFQSPLFLTGLPVQTGVQFLNVDMNDTPVQNGFMDAPFDISIPCSVFDPMVVSRPIYLGHGIFGTGQGMVDTVPNQKARFARWTYIAGGTDWIGLSDRRDDATDEGWIAQYIIGLASSQLNNLPAFFDRLRQGMLNALVLSRMMKDGLFNRDPAFQISPGVFVFPGPTEDLYYYGISLGGIHGTWMSALAPDIDRFGLDVPAVNFSCLLQRSTQFSAFETIIHLIGINDPMQFALFIDVINELWVSAEPAGYATHITSDPLPGSGSAKHIYYTPSWLDKQVSNQCTEAAERTLGLSNVAGSIQQGLQGIPDVAGPVPSGFILYDGGSFDILNPLLQPYIPPLANQIPSPVCDPHNFPRNIPAAIRSMLNFLQPGGQVQNFCNGLCDAGETLEIPNGGSCDMSSPVPGQACVLDADCAPGSCVPTPICNPLGP